MKITMIDLGWIYAIVEASAAFVAIVCAFFTTKILSIASERKVISNRVEMLKKEIGQRRKLVDIYQEEIDSIGFKWAEEEVRPFLEKVQYDVDSENPPSLEDLIRLFEEEEDRVPNYYERELLKKKYSEFLNMVQAIAKEREAERQASEKSPFAGLGALFGLSRTMRRFTLVNLKPPGVVMREAERLDEVLDKRIEESSRIAILENQKKDSESQLRALSFPKYVTLGFLSLIYFAIVGVAVPLAFVLWAKFLEKYISEFHIFILFLSGLSGALAYLYLEIRQALKKH